MQIIWNDNILQTMLIVSVLILVLLFFRKILLRFSVKRIIVIVWAAVLVRLIMPVQIQVQIPYSAMGERWNAICDFCKESFFQPIVLIIWGIGVLVTVGVFVFSYLKCKQVLGESLPITKLPAVEEDLFTFMGIDVYISDRITSPITYGILRQKILIPKIFMDLPREQLKYVLIHEKIHIDRHDNLRKFFMIAAASVYWFHPLVWLMYYFYNQDIEISCDEKVLRRVGVENREGYAMALIFLAEHGTSRAPMYSGFGQNAVKKRIVYIMKYRKNPTLGIIGAVLFILPLLASFVSLSVTKKEVPVSTEPVITYQQTAQETKVLSEDKYKNSVNILAENKDGIDICFRIWKDRKYAELHGKSFSDNMGTNDDWQPSVSKKTMGVLRVPEAVEYEGTMYPVEVLGDYSFYKCEKVTQILLPSTVKKIRKDSFYGCTGLTELELPVGLEEIENNPFRGCTSLENFIMKTNGMKGNYVTREGVLYSDFGRYIKAYPQGRKDKTYRIPKDVTRIAKKSCYGALFSSVKIPVGVYLIGAKAFAHCNNLTVCTIPKKAKIEADSFDEKVSKVFK